MVYFPDEVFRNIASYLIDPYKAEKEKHASVWQTIRVKRERVTEDRGNGDYSETELDEYFVYLKGGKCGSPYVSIPFRFEPDDHLCDYDNLHELIEYFIDGEYGGCDDEWYNYAFEQYE